MFESFWFFKFSSTIKYCSCYPKIFTYHFSLFSFQGAIFASQELFSLRESNLWSRTRTTCLFWLIWNFVNKISYRVQVFCIFVEIRLFFASLAYAIRREQKKVEFLENWWAQVDSNHRPHAYQACALTTWAMSPYKRWPLPFRVVEMNGIEPMTPCLQSRCSPSWAIPPSTRVPSKLNNVKVSPAPESWP